MPCSESSYSQAEIGLDTRLRFRTLGGELIHEVFAHETEVVSQISNQFELLEFTLTKLRTNIGAP